jgi:hypothetical protein
MKKMTVVQEIVVGLATLLVVVGAIAGPSTRKTKLTFSQPVLVPGATLTAGTYFFQAPNMNNRTLVRITDQSGKFVTQFMGIADYIRKPDHDIITFGNQDCKPTAIKAWFYPGSRTAVRFVYQQEQAARIATSCNEPVPEMHGSVTDVSQLQGDKVYVATPKGQEEEYKPEALSASDQADKDGLDADATAPQPK